MILTIANQKGGCAKSTLAVNLAVCAARGGARVLLVDADPQATAMDWVRVRDPERQPSIAGIQMSRPVLHRQLPELSDPFDLVLVDVGGRDDRTLRSALLAADRVLVPLGPAAPDAWATDDVIELLGELMTGRPLQAWAVLTRVVAGTNVARETAEHLRQGLDARELPVTLIPDPIIARVAWSAAFGEGLGVQELSRRSKAALELERLAAVLGIPGAAR